MVKPLKDIAGKTWYPKLNTVFKLIFLTAYKLNTL